MGVNTPVAVILHASCFVNVNVFVASYWLPIRVIIAVEAVSAVTT